MFGCSTLGEFVAWRHSPENLFASETKNIYWIENMKGWYNIYIYICIYIYNCIYVYNCISIYIWFWVMIVPLIQKARWLNDLLFHHQPSLFNYIPTVFVFKYIWWINHYHIGGYPLVVQRFASKHHNVWTCRLVDHVFYVWAVASIAYHVVKSAISKRDNPAIPMTDWNKPVLSTVVPPS